MKTAKRIVVGTCMFICTMSICLLVLSGCEAFGTQAKTVATEVHYVSDPTPTPNPSTQPSTASLLDEIRQIVQSVAPNVPYGNAVLGAITLISGVVGAAGATVVTSKTTNASASSKYGALITELVNGIQTYADSTLPWSAQLTAELTKLGLHDAATPDPSTAKPTKTN